MQDYKTPNTLGATMSSWCSEPENAITALTSLPSHGFAHYRLRTQGKPHHELNSSEVEENPSSALGYM